MLTKEQIKSIFILVENNDVKGFRSKWQEFQTELSDFMTRNNGSWLQHACQGDKDKIAKFLIESGEDINYRSRDESKNFGIVPFSEYFGTAIDSAIFFNSYKCLNILLNSGVEMSSSAISYYIKLAIERRSLNCLHSLVEFGLDLQKCYMPGVNAMSYAMMYKSTEMINYLTELGCKLHEGFNLPSATLKVKLEPRVIQSRKIDQDGEVEFYCGHDDGMNATKFYTLGASDLAVKISSPEFEGFRFVEFFIDLPSNWPTDADSLKDPP